MADVTISSLPLGTPSGNLIVPISDGSNTYGASLSDIQVNYNSLVSKPVIPAGVPVGAVFHIATSTTPAGYLICNGNSVPNGSGIVQGITADFSALFSVLGSTYGSAGRLPDLRGEFIRGWDGGRGIDSGRAFGSGQKGTAMTYNTPRSEAIIHGVGAGTDNADTANGVALGEVGADRGNKAVDYPNTVGWYVGTGAGSLNTGDWMNDPAWGGGVTRPRNLALLPVIKY